MALIRCVEHKPTGRGEPYVDKVKPVGYENTAAICGLEYCEKPGLIWLKEPDLKRYKDGERIFTIHTNSAKIKASD